MIRCKDCGANQPRGSLYCSECGRNLLQDVSQETNVLPFSEFVHRPPPPPLSKLSIHPAPEVKELTFVIPGSRRRQIVPLTAQIKVGRIFEDADNQNNLDLTEDNGSELGVSRLHAMIQWSNQGVVLVDLDSTNGTFLNGHQLPAQKPYPLQSGDEICFGELLCHIFFT
jgi:hypothetical protein